jgi:hypothetical protein
MQGITENRPLHIVNIFAISSRIEHDPNTIATCLLGGKLQY